MLQLSNRKLLLVCFLILFHVHWWVMGLDCFFCTADWNYYEFFRSVANWSGFRSHGLLTRLGRLFRLRFTSEYITTRCNVTRNITYKELLAFRIFCWSKTRPLLTHIILMIILVFSTQAGQKAHKQWKKEYN